VVSGLKFDGAVSVENEVQRVVRSLDVTSAEYILPLTSDGTATNGMPVVFRMCACADKDALIALHKLWTHLGSPVEIEASRAWLRSQG
jgi:hypothetical protein